MNRAGWQQRLRSRWFRLVLGCVLVIALAGIVLGIATGGGGIRVSAQFVPGTPEAGHPVLLDTSLYLPAQTPAPAVLLTQGFGSDKQALDGRARTYASHGYVVLTYSARGFGRSGGLIHFASPDYEVHDGVLLLDWLANRPEVRHVAGEPQLATAGSSYGGALSLLIAGADPQVRAVAADITWNNLQQALFPNAAGSAPGVFKKEWAGRVFSGAFSPAAGESATCGRFAPQVCAAFQASAADGTPTAAMRRFMRQASPAAVISSIRVPVLLTQGEQDSLFPLSEADATARELAAHGTPVRVVWRSGGHDAPGVGAGVATDEALRWFDAAFAGKVSTAQPFRYSEQAAVVSAATGSASEEIRQATGYPGIAGTAQDVRAVPVLGAPQVIGAPAGGTPSVITAIPGLGGVSNRVAQALSQAPAPPGQTATFVSARLTRQLLVAGIPTVRLVITPRNSQDVVLFVALRDLAPDGAATLPSQLVAPLRLTGLRPGTPRAVTVRLPGVVRNVLAGHRLMLTVSTTDFAYAAAPTARSYTVALAGGSAPVSVPTVSGTAITGGHPVTWLIAGAALFAVVLTAVGLVIIRRRLTAKFAPALAEVPVSVESLVKEYSGGYRAVDDVSFRVERGQVVGLLGPNGAGKTTALRVLVGLITPTAGRVHVFGEPVLPGAPVLARVGAFIEGPGFLPHLTGRENLELYWAATGRPAAEAELDTALEIAGLGPSVDRRVRTYSHGMKQRLAIAQAMLGLPEVLVLDEPTNGLDPPQIAEMREVLHDYARTGRTVLISSHLLAEVEQTCSHVVVMHKGRLVAAGPTLEIAGAGGLQLAVADPAAAARVLAAAGIAAQTVPARRALEDVFLELIDE